MSIILVIVIIVMVVALDKYATENKKLNKKINGLIEENKNLKIIIKKMKDYYIDHKEEKNVNINNLQDKTVQNVAVQNAEIKSENVQREVAKEVKKENVVKQVRREEKVIDKNKIKNTTILLTGAFLLILAAIVLLMSTWSILPNFIKTLVLFMFVLVFVGISNKAEKMGLKDTSKTFFNLAMAYIPICLVSISLFGLLGEYLSVNGDGKFIYLTAVFLAISGIYYKVSKEKDSKGLFYSSIISQLFTVVLFSLIFETNLNLVLLNVCLYNILLLIVPSKDNFVKITNMILSYVSLFVGFMIIFVGENNFLTMLGIGANFASFAIIAKRKPNAISGYSMNTSLIVFMISILKLPILNLNISTNLLLLMFSLIASLIIEENLLSSPRYKDVKYSNYILTFIAFIIIFISSGLNHEVVFVKYYVVALIMTALSTIIYLKYKNEFFAIAMPITFVIFGSCMLKDFKYDMMHHALLIPAIMQFIVFKMFVLSHKDAKKVIEPVINILLVLMSWSANFVYSAEMANDFGYFAIIFALFAISNRISENKQEESVYRVLSYCSGFTVLSSFFNLILEKPENLIAYIPLIITIISIVLENLYTEFDDKTNKVVRTIGILLSSWWLATTSGIVSSMMIGISNIGIILYNRIKNENEMYDLPVLIGALFTLALNTSDSTEIIVEIFMLLFTACTTALTISKQKTSFYTIMSYIFLISFMDFCNNTYINIILFLLNSLIHIPYMKSEKDKDIFKFLSAVSGLCLYMNFVNDFIKLEMISLQIAGWMVATIYIHDYILEKYIEKPKALKIITYIIIYIWGFTALEEMADFMMIMFIQLIVIMYGYSQRQEAEFISSVVMLIANAFLLTAGFWFAIPWWIYFILIGGALISFGIKNESKENKTNRLKERYNERFK